MKEFLKMMATSAQGGISSKIVIGGITYVMLVVAMIVCMFVKPEFAGLTELIITCVVTSASLLGLTTVENIRQQPKIPEE